MAPYPILGIGWAPNTDPPLGRPTMTAATATPTAPPAPADVFPHLEHPSARALAGQLAGLPPDTRRALAAEAVETRRDDLLTYRLLYLEVYGHALDQGAIEDGDDLLTELLVLAIA